MGSSSSALKLDYAESTSGRPQRKRPGYLYFVSEAGLKPYIRDIYSSSMILWVDLVNSLGGTWIKGENSDYDEDEQQARIWQLCKVGPARSKPM